MTGFKRAGNGNVTGISEVKKGLDSPKQKLVLINPSLLQKLKQHAFVKGISESEIVRNALKAYLK